MRKNNKLSKKKTSIIIELNINIVIKDIGRRQRSAILLLVASEG